MKFGHFSFGSIQIDDTKYEHDVIIDRGQILKRKKKPSKRFQDELGTRRCLLMRTYPGSASSF